MDITITEICCCECKVTFWISGHHNKELQGNHKTFYCPNGHQQSYFGKTDAEKAEEQRDRYKKWYESKQATCERLVRSNSALRGVVTRQKNKE